MPGIILDLVEKVETFAHDFTQVLDHLDAPPVLRAQAVMPFNASEHDDWPAYYTAELANMVYRAYEADFDGFRYPRAFAY